MNASSFPPQIGNSTREERLEYIRARFRCISDCDQCGLCKIFHNRDAEDVYKDYIDGTRSFVEISLSIRR